MSTPEERRDARLKAAKESAAGSFKSACVNGFVDVGSFWQRSVELARKAFPAEPASATLASHSLQLATFRSGKDVDCDTLLDLLRSAPMPAGGWPLGSDSFPTGNNKESRQLARAFAEAAWATKDVDALALQTALREADAPPGPTAPAPGAVRQDVSIKTTKERDEERITKARAWLAKHVPQPTVWPAISQPSQSMMAKFTEWRTADAAPAVLQLSEYVKEGRAQSVTPGRQCSLSDVICVINAMQTMYAGPMPAGCRKDKEVDTTMIEWTETKPDPADPAKSVAVTVGRPACLSGKIVAESIAALTAALAPLSEKQRASIADRLWNELIKETGTLNGYSYSRAFKLAFLTSRVFTDACQEEAEKAEERPDQEKLTPRGGRDRDRRDDRDRDRRPNKRTGLSPEEKTRDKEAKKSRPVCRDWEKDGACRDHEKGRCKEHRHPEDWRGRGRAEAEKLRKQ